LFLPGFHRANVLKSFESFELVESALVCSVPPATTNPYFGPRSTTSIGHKYHFTATTWEGFYKTCPLTLNDDTISHKNLSIDKNISSA
jgi:hypothetical protein